MSWRLSLILTFFSMTISLTACTLDLSLVSEGTSRANLLVFDSSYIDTSLLSSKITMSSANISGGDVQINFEMLEGIQKNKVRFKNLPDGAAITCDNTAGNRALQRIDLLGEKSFQLQPNFWVPTEAEWTAQEHQSFSCYYEVNGQKSNTIEFKVRLKEASHRLVSAPQYTGLEKFGGSTKSAISADGRYIVQTIEAGVVREDVNNVYDAYLYDRELGKITLVSKSSDGTVGNGASTDVNISADGRYVVFSSEASNLVNNDANGVSDIFVHDTQTGITKMVSVASNGTQGNGHSFNSNISADGRYVAFVTASSNLVSGDTNSREDIFVHDVQTGTTKRISVASDGTQGNNSSVQPSMSADGRYVTFESEATNLVGGDTNNWSDVFIHDTQTGITTRASVALDGSQGNASSQYPSISADGRYVTFSSGATGLVGGDNNGVVDIFVKDTQTGAVTRVSVDSSGIEADSWNYGPRISANGRYVTFYSTAANLVSGDTNNAMDVFVHDIQTGTTTRASLDSTGTQGTADSYDAKISTDGRYIAFTSEAANLVSGDNNNSSDIFVRDVQESVTIKLPLEASGTSTNEYSYSPSLSADGRYVTFISYANNLVSGDTNNAEDIFVRDNQTGEITRVSVDSAGAQGNGDSYSPSISADGRYVAFESWSDNLVVGDTNDVPDIFVHDTQTGVTKRVSVVSGGAEGNNVSYWPSISADGRYVAFMSRATNLVVGDTNGSQDVFIHDLQTGITTRVSVDSAGVQGNLDALYPSISADGRYVAFQSAANNLVSGDTNGLNDIFVHDVQTGATTRVSVDSSGAQANNNAIAPSMSADGRFVAFHSDASNLVSGDSNGARDAFVHDTQTGTTVRVSVDSNGTQGDANSQSPSLSADGRYVVFYSDASNLVSGDSNGALDIFVHDTQTGATARVSAGDSSGSEGYGSSDSRRISADGRYVVFVSDYSSQVENDVNWVQDVILSRNPMK
nr:hypothetical protein [uncultured Bdellovibrio sp.]